MRHPSNRMRLCLSILFRPLFFLILLGLACYMVGEVCLKINEFKHTIISQADVVRHKTVLEVENAAKMLRPLNSSALSLATALSVNLNGTDLTFPIIQAKIAPSLFQALTTIPRVTEVGYMGLDRLEFSYYHDDEQTFAFFSNTTSASITYTQPVNRDTGKLFGEAVGSNSTVAFNTTKLVKGPERILPQLSLVVGKNQHLLFKSIVPMDGRGLISIGFPADEVKTQFSDLDFHGSHLHLAASDGQVLLETKLPDAQISVDNGTYSLKLKKQNGVYEDIFSKVSCKSDDDDQFGYLDVKINEKKHKFYCSTVNIAGIDSVYVLAFPVDGVETAVHENSMLAIVFLVLMLVGTVVSLCLFIFLILKAARREIVLCDALIKQKESTQQAERKSMNKTNAFATNSHDLRSNLSTINSIIKLCHEDVIPDPRLATNLEHIDKIVQDMLGRLRTVLDKSKIEAGKIELVEGEFNLAQVLEDVVDKYYPVGINKCVDVILDHCDSSILKFYLVRGDRQKLKEILENLLSNAIKFTSEGHVVVRTIVRKTSKENAIIASNRRSTLKCLSRLCYKNSGSLRSVDDIQTVHENPNCMEFIFEVDDTGCGIPKERQKSVFENYVQVTPASGQQGWGLGLGIVQSLVRLMGGEIRIVDKENGVKGTCFRFNIFLPVCNPVSAVIDEHGNHMQSGVSSIDLLHYLGSHIRSPAARLEGSHVILLLAGKERRKVSKKVIENFGIKVSVAETSKELRRILDKLKERLDHLQHSLSEKSESSPIDYLSVSSNSISGLNEGPSASGAKDGHDSSVPQRKNSNCKGLHSFILIFIDAAAAAAAASSSELSASLSSFKKETRNFQCKVVWWDNPIIHNRNSKEMKKDRPLALCDYNLRKPFHGSGLYDVLGLLPEFRGASPPDSLNVKAAAVQENEGSTEIVPPNRLIQFPSNHGLQKWKISQDEKQQLQEIVIHDPAVDQSSAKPLKGKSVLVVDDILFLRKLVSKSVSKLGARVEVCENGKEAFDKICQLLNDAKELNQEALPYDYIIMDCEMPVMDGYEATKLIRKEEKLHGIHIPIFALTAHAMPEEHTKIVDAGMDFYLCKPFDVSKLLDAIRVIECKSGHF